MIFGCGASDLKDELMEFNETFTYCVIDIRDDARLFRKMKMFIFHQITGLKPIKIGNFS